MERCIAKVVKGECDFFLNGEVVAAWSYVTQALQDAPAPSHPQKIGCSKLPMWSSNARTFLVGRLRVYTWKFRLRSRQ